MNANKNINESHRASQHPSVKAERSQCFINAFRVVMHVPGFANATYVEGVAVLNGLCIEHGWVEKDGEIIDTTLPDGDLVYFAGLRFAGQAKLSKALQIPKESYCDDLPLFYRFGWGGSDSEEFTAARKKAMDYNNMLVAAKNDAEHAQDGQDLSESD